MAFKTIFKRYEYKYLLTDAQKDAVIKAMQGRMLADSYGKSTIRNIYFDTDTYLLIRRSIEKPVYKEKLRIRSYSKANPDSTVFVELKKKYKHVVYKRRLSICESNAMSFVCDNRPPQKQTQITNEIEYFLSYYKNLHPAVFLSYEREAFFSKEESDFRITFDRNILARESDLSLTSDVYGTPLLPEGITLMEIKCAGGIPLWMVHTLSQNGIYKTSFSKYGTAYKNLIFPKEKTKHA